MDFESRVREITFAMTGIESFSSSIGEKALARWIYEELLKIPYFKERPGSISMVDRDGVNYVWAFLKSDDEVDKTVALTGHFDVVDVDCYGSLGELAFDPMSLTEKLRGRSLGEDAKNDLHDGWLFGRGIADMKCGLAVEMALLEYWAIEGAPCNILFLAVGDEENLSSGMRAASEDVAQLVESEGLDISVWVNGEPSVGLEKRSWAVYRGTVGKVMGFVLSVGVAAHVGDFFNGISAVQIGGQINSHIEGNPRTSDMKDDGFYLPPAACLGFEALRDRYSVTLYDKVFAKYNLLYGRREATDLLDILKDGAQRGLDSTLSLTASSASLLGEVLNLKNGRVLSYDELFSIALEKNPDLEDKISSLDDDQNPMTRAKNEILLVLKLSGLEGPLAVVGFMPPWYPARSAGGGEKQAVVDRALESSCKMANDAGYDSIIEDLFEGICDLSYIGSPKADSITYMTDNMAGWGSYYIPFHASARLEAPVCNIGPIGADIHQLTERLDPDFAFSLLPYILKNFVENIANS